MTHTTRCRQMLFISVAVVTALAFPSSRTFAAKDAPADKPVIHSQSELPRYSYKLPTPTASALLTDPAFTEVAAKVRADIEKQLDSYTIEDKSTLRTLYGTLVALDMMDHDYDAALEGIAKVRDLQEKPAERLASGLAAEAIVKAERAGGDMDARVAMFRTAYADAVNQLPWDIVQDTIESTKGQLEIVSPNLITGMVQSQYDPAAKQTGEIGGEVAYALVGMRELIDVVLPYKQAIIDVLQAYIDENRTEKANIWAERDVDLTNATDLHPVVIGIWDSGVDASVYADRMFRNTGEQINSKDDDGNGYVDDVNGIAYALWGGAPTPELLYPLDEATRERLPGMRDQMKGFMDIRASVDSPEAKALKKRMSEMEPDQVKPMMEDLGRFANFAHGTHVAGIAVAGNPAARILVVRETFPYEVVPPPISKKGAERWAGNMQKTVKYLKKHNVRVVNMSWGITAKDIEDIYEVNGMGETPEKRQKMAQETFDVLMAGMRKAIKSAPDILFVPAAGNSDEDINFTVDMPAAIDLPNVLAVGAVDQAGDETSFTCYGKSVRVDANGFEVESYLPGGERLKLSGTSMAAPNVTNLAGKLFALDPKLKPKDVVSLIIEGANTSEDGRRVLINPKRSVELLRAQTKK